MSKQPIYFSVTSTFDNQELLFKCLETCLLQTIMPDKIFIWLSEEPYLLDKGFTNKRITNPQLINLIEQNKDLLEIRWVDNEGPFRKLIPILKEKWNEDCFIITIDDDIIYKSILVETLLNDYNKHKCVISYRCYLPPMKSLETFKYKHKWVNGLKHIWNFPTNGAGSLYKPEFFHKTKDLIFNKEIYLKTCDKRDDVWYYIVRIKNNVECYGNCKKRQYNFQPCPSNKKVHNGLFHHFNKKNDNNTKAFINTLNLFKKIGI